MLTCSGLSKKFGESVALHDVDVRIGEGEIVSVIGPNGSGKSTLINLISGLYPADSGTIQLDDHELTGHRPQAIRSLGVSRTFQNLRLFSELSLLDNMLLGLHLEYVGGRGMVRSYFATQLRLPAYRRRDASERARAAAALETIGLAEKQNESVVNLSYGERKRAELVQSMLASPKLLLLDEPTAGLSPREADAVRELFHRPAKEDGLAVLLVEHRLEWVLEVSDRVVVLDAGGKIADGLPRDVADDPQVKKVYIGD